MIFHRVSMGRFEGRRQTLIEEVNRKDTSADRCRVAQAMQAAARVSLAVSS
jgi:hypothetical protein